MISTVTVTVKCQQPCVSLQLVLQSLCSTALTLHKSVMLPLQTFAVAIALPTSVAVFMLLIWHIRMISHNKTTIEHAEVSMCKL